MSDIFTQLFMNGVIAGSLYALIAVGFSLISSTNGFIHFAHGGVITLSAYFFYWISKTIQMPFFIACLLTIAFSAFLGYCLHKTCYQPFRNKKASTSTLLITSIALSFLFQALILLLFGAGTKTVISPFSNESFNLLGSFITPTQVITVIISLASCFTFEVFLQKTKLGTSLRAVADNKDAAEVLGIASEKMRRNALIIGSAFAGIASIFVTLEQSISPSMGTALTIKGFTGSILGGLGDIHGALAGSFFLGLAEHISTWFLPSGLKEILLFILLFLLLIFKPQGFLRNKKI